MRNTQTNVETSQRRRNRAKLRHVPPALRAPLIDLLRTHKREHGTEALFIVKTHEEIAALTLGALDDSFCHATDVEGVGYQDGRQVLCVDGWRRHFDGEPLPAGEVWADVVGRFFGVRIGLNKQAPEMNTTAWYTAAGFGRLIPA